MLLSFEVPDGQHLFVDEIAGRGAKPADAQPNVAAGSGKKTLRMKQSGGAVVEDAVRLLREGVQFSLRGIVQLYLSGAAAALSCPCSHLPDLTLSLPTHTPPSSPRSTTCSNNSLASATLSWPQPSSTWPRPPRQTTCLPAPSTSSWQTSNSLTTSSWM